MGCSGSPQAGTVHEPPAATPQARRADSHWRRLQFLQRAQRRPTALPCLDAQITSRVRSPHHHGAKETDQALLGHYNHSTRNLQQGEESQETEQTTRKYVNSILKKHPQQTQEQTHKKNVHVWQTTKSFFMRFQL